MSQPDKTRSLDQNALMWAALTDIAEQVPWPVNGHMSSISAEDFKHILTAGLHKEHRIAAGIDGGFVILGQSTRKMTRAQFSELMDFIFWFGAERGVKFGAGHTYDDYKEAYQ